MNTDHHMNENRTLHLGKQEQRLFALWRKECLQDAEKRAIRQSLALRMGVKHTGLRERAQSFFSVFSYKKSLAFSLGVMILLVSSGIGVVSASERSLPGETLYPFKTAVVEPIRGTFSMGTSKADWERKRIERRMEEKAKLAAQGRLGERESKKIDSLIMKHETALSTHTASDDMERSEGLNVQFEGVEKEERQDGDVKDSERDDYSENRDEIRREKKEKKRIEKNIEKKSNSKSVQKKKKEESKDDKPDEERSGSDDEDDNDDEDEEDDSDGGDDGDDDEDDNDDDEDE